MKEIKDKKIYKTVTMVSNRPTYIDVFNLLSRWENRFGDRLIIGEKALEEVIESLGADADDFYAETGLSREQVDIRFDDMRDDFNFFSVKVTENKDVQRYSLIIETPCSVYVEDEEEEGGEE